MPKPNDFQLHYRQVYHNYIANSPSYHGAFLGLHFLSIFWEKNTEKIHAFSLTQHNNKKEWVTKISKNHATNNNRHVRTCR